MSIRVDLLNQAIQLTDNERNAVYGPPEVNLACAAELKAVYDKYATWDAGLAHREAIHMQLTKISRIACGGEHYHQDSYIDNAAYGAIAGEVHPQAKCSAGPAGRPGEAMFMSGPMVRKQQDLAKALVRGAQAGNKPSKSMPPYDDLAMMGDVK